jgi:predicted enzyme related to lactoylglutathione lyase
MAVSIWREQEMSIAARYVHTNLIAEDWRRLAAFYERLFGCVPIPPERDYQGEQVAAGSGIAGAHLRGVHLRLPGYDENGPTLEVFSYNVLAPRGQAAANRPGFGHVAFAVEDVAAARAEVLQAGGRAVGEIVTLQTATGASVTWCYVTDPEGNIVELQAWSSSGAS